MMATSIHPSELIGAMPPRERVPCPACATDRHCERFTKQGFVVVRCEHCGLDHINPQPSDRELEEIYRLWGETYFADARQIASDFSEAKYEAELEVLAEATTERGRLLDIGCATGSFLHFARSRGFDVQGVEISAPSIEIARSRYALNVIQGDFSSGIFDEASFDVVTMWASVEHLRRPLDYLREAHRVLKPGAKLIVSVPNSSGLAARLLGPRYRYVCIEHLCYFTPDTLTLLLRNAGFVDTKMLTRKFNPIVLINDMRGFQPAPESQITHNQHMQDLKTSSKWRLLRGAHSFVANALGRARLGDLLFGVATR